MADQNNITIRLIVKDEMSKQLGDIAAAANKLNAAATGQLRREVNQTTQAVERLTHSFGNRLRQEFSSTLSLIGGGLIGGGLVAGMVAATRSITEFARSNVQLHYTARGLETTSGLLHKYAAGLQVMGQDSGQAVGNITNAATKLRDLQRYGAQSELGKWLEQARGGKTLMRELQQAMSGPDAQAGMERGMQLLMERMANMRLGKGQSPLTKALGMGPFDPAKLLEMLKQLVPRIEPNIQLFERWLLATTNLNTSFGNIKTRLIEAMVPGMEGMATALSSFLKSDEGEAFVKKLEAWAGALSKYLASEDFKKDFATFTTEFGKAVGVLQAAFDLADPVIKALGLSWGQVIGVLVASQFVPWLGTLGLALRAIAAMKWLFPLLPAIAAASDILKGPKTPEEFQKKKEELEKSAPSILEDWLFWFRKKQSELGTDDAGGNKLAEALSPLHDELSKLTDNLMTGGPEGKADGTSGYGAGVGGGGDMPVLGPAGGGKSNRPYPTLPEGATALSAIPGTVRPAQTAGMGFASWYGNRPELGFRDTEDQGRQGVSERDQGIALGRTQTLGQYHEITDPHSGLTHIARQTDTGPNIRTQKLLDIHASQLARMGYTAKTFPDAKGLWKVKPAGFGQPGQQAAWAGRGGAFDEGGTEGTERTINRGIGSDYAALSGSATVDIDVGGLVAAQSRSSGLFRPSRMGTSPQMPQTGGGMSNYNTFNLE